MVIKRVSAKAIMVLGLMAGSVQADVEDGTRIDSNLVGRLLEWVKNETGYHAPSQPVVVASQKKFQLVMKMKGVHYADARALYIPGMVVLDNKSWKQEDPVQLSLLVHELVHHAQLYSGRHYPCAAAKEYEAYAVQNKWLEERGYPPFASQGWINTMASCEAEQS
jgi:hypothetical protein